MIVATPDCMYHVRDRVCGTFVIDSCKPRGWSRRFIPLTRADYEEINARFSLNMIGM
jgi:hypothetical protein